MGQESLSLFPSETDRDINRTAVVKLVRSPIPQSDDQLAMFGAIEAPAPRPSLPPPFPPVRPGHPRTAARTPVAIVASIAILGLTGLALLRPANSAPSNAPSPVAVLSPPLSPVVEAAAVQSIPVEPAPSIQTPAAVVPAYTSAPAPESAPALAPVLVPVPPPARPAPAAPRARDVRPRVSPAKVEPRSEGRAKSAANAPAFTGTLIVDSVPQGAAVTMNQKPVGVTPLRLPAHPAGSYAIWVEHEGFERWTAGVRVTANSTTRVNPTLKSRSLAP